jgi:signal transduction histidine kinase
MHFRRSLRYRVGLALALTGGVASLLLAVWLFLFFHNIEFRFIDDALDSEIEEFYALRKQNPAMSLPRTSLLRAYATRFDVQDATIPEALRPLGPGRHQLNLNGRGYRVAVVDRADERTYFLYDESGLMRRERRILYALGAAVLAMMLVSAAAGVWLAGRVIAPVRELGQRVRGLAPGADAHRLASDFPADEVGELATTIEGYLTRLHAFVEREQHFTADASHELRTPVSVISGAVEVMLADRELSPRMRERVERIARSVRDMRIVMDSLLALAREAGGHEPNHGECDVAEVVAEVIEQHRPLAHGKPVTMQLEVAAEPRLAVPRALLAVAAGNLVRNALTYTPEGNVSVRVEADRLIVEDTGPGFAGTAGLGNGTGRAGGAGIGLSLVRRVCERLGWTLVAQDRPGGARAEIVFGAGDAPSAKAQVL